MEIKIGIQNTPRELVVETNEDAQTIETIVEKALDRSMLTLTDTKGKKTIVPTQYISYIEIGAEEQRRVGFGN